MFGDTTSGSNTSTQTNSIHTYNGGGNYEVILIATNSSGCMDTATQIISVSKSNDLFVPTTFTPNSDGHNDVFRVRGRDFQMNEMDIFDQWGTLIYQTNASKPIWDGMSKGELVQNGTYVYRIKITLKNNEEMILNGAITVIK